jgi:LacI family transcriptional regulator
MKRVTIKDIARSLCISVSTVSRALTDDKNIRRETREAVLREAERLGYRRNPVAMNLKMGRTNTIGVIVPEMHTPYASQVVAGIQSVLYKNNQKVMIAESDENPDRERESLQMMEEFMVDGLIVSLCSYKHNIETYRRLANEGVAIVFYDRIPHGMDDMPQVMVDDNNDSYFMAEHLIRLGRRRIAYLYGPDDVYNAVERGRGYREAMEKFQIYDPRLIVKTGMTFADGAAAVDSLVRQGIEFDAVYAFTDTLAIGAMNRLREKGRCIPEDVAVAGFSGTELSTIVFPQLTTVEPPLTEMGQRAAELVLEKVRNPEAENRKIVLRTEMKCRASTGE